MANKPRTPMPIAERAKQFLPFAAVKGLPEALAKKEKVDVPKLELTEERALDLDEKLKRLAKGMTVKITYYAIDRYVTLSGTAIFIDRIHKSIQVEDEIIELEDVLEMEIL